MTNNENKTERPVDKYFFFKLMTVLSFVVSILLCFAGLWAGGALAIVLSGINMVIVAILMYKDDERADKKSITRF